MDNSIDINCFKIKEELQELLLIEEVNRGPYDIEEMIEEKCKQLEECIRESKKKE